jgi:hypothetical protein
MPTFSSPATRADSARLPMPFHDGYASPAGVRPITLDPPATGAIIEFASERTRRDPCQRAY